LDKLIPPRTAPSTEDQLKSKRDKSKRKKGKKRGPKYDHPGKTRNGFGEPDEVEKLLENCPNVALMSNQ